MNEFYVEHLIKRKRTIRDILIKIFMMVITINTFLLVKIHYALLLIPLMLAVLTGMVFYNLNVEYEYFYMNGNLEIDRIASRSRRRRVFEMKIYDLEVLVPEGAPETQPYRSVKVKNYTSRRPEAQRYEMIVTQGRTKQKILWEPNDVILESMKKIEPRKVLI